jgi:hypothetical protein
VCALSNRIQDNVLCLLCYMNVPTEVQREYGRVDAPAQYGDPPPRTLPLLGTKTVSFEEHLSLVQEYESFKLEKEAAAKVVARHLLNRANEVEKLTRDLEEARKRAAEHSSMSRETGVSKVNEKDLMRLRSAHSSLSLEFERLKVENEEAARASADFAILAAEVERLKADKEEHN